MPRTSTSLDRAASVAFWAHGALVAFSTAAMVTIVAGDFPRWMQGPYTAQVYTLGWKYSGQAYILLGALAALLFVAARFGWAKSLALFGIASGVALLSELGGTNIGLPFGPYRYTEMLGYRIVGDVPYPIPISWFYMLVACLAFCARLLRCDDSAAAKWRGALLAAAFLTAWDVPMEVQMTNVQPVHWIWELERGSMLPDFLLKPVFYGMPLSNWVGWYITGVVVSRLMLAVVPPARWAATEGVATLPLLLYATNAVMPLATVARQGYWAAFWLGLAAMGLPVWLVLRARKRATGALGAHPASA